MSQVQHIATPERQQRRRDMKLIGKRQYKKISFALKIRALDKERPKRVIPHNGPDGDPYTYITYPVEGSDPMLNEMINVLMTPLEASGISTSSTKGEF